jgi:hypothetical protein
VQDVDNENPVILDAVENQVIAIRTAADTVMLVAWNDRKGTGISPMSLALA